MSRHPEDEGLGQEGKDKICVQLSSKVFETPSLPTVVNQEVEIFMTDHHKQGITSEDVDSQTLGQRLPKTKPKTLGNKEFSGS